MAKVRKQDNKNNQEQNKKNYECKRGYGEKFDHKTQLYRHKIIYKGKSPRKIKQQ